MGTGLLSTGWFSACLILNREKLETETITNIRRWYEFERFRAVV